MGLGMGPKFRGSGSGLGSPDLDFGAFWESGLNFGLFWGVRANIWAYFGGSGLDFGLFLGGGVGPGFVSTLVALAWI